MHPLLMHNDIIMRTTPPLSFYDSLPSLMNNKATLIMALVCILHQKVNIFSLGVGNLLP